MSTYKSFRKVLQISVLAFLVLLTMGSAVFLPSHAATVSLKLSPVRGIIGTQVTVTGKGFLDSSTVTLSFGSTKLTSVKSNSTGGISTTFTVPNVGPGSQKVTATDGTDSLAATFTVGSRAKVTEKLTLGSSGTDTVTITGKNFADSASYTVTLNSKAVKTLSTATTTSTGTISNSFTMTNTPGDYTIVVTDSLGYVASVSFDLT